MFRRSIGRAIAIPVALAGLFFVPQRFHAPVVSSSVSASVPSVSADSSTTTHPYVRAALMRQVLARSVAACPGEASVVISCPEEGWDVTRNADAVVPAASVIKLPILLALHSLADRGELSFDEPVVLETGDLTGGAGNLKFRGAGSPYRVSDLAEKMIVESDNTATNALIRHVGREKLDAEFRALALERTRLDHAILRSPEDNPTTAAEMAHVLASLLPSGSPASSDAAAAVAQRLAVRDLLERARNRRRLGRFLPAAVPLAHKTGTLRSVIHDVGIISTPHGEVVLSALVTRVANPDAAELWLGKLGKTVFEAMGGVTSPPAR